MRSSRFFTEDAVLNRFKNPSTYFDKISTVAFKPVSVYYRPRQPNWEYKMWNFHVKSILANLMLKKRHFDQMSRFEFSIFGYF